MSISNLGTVQLTDNKTGISRTYPFHVDSIRQTQMFAETAGIPHEEYFTKMSEMQSGNVLTNTAITINFLWSCLYAGAIRINRKCDFVYEDVVDMYEEATPTEKLEFIKIIQVFHAEVKKKTEGLLSLMHDVSQNKTDFETAMAKLDPTSRMIIEQMLKESTPSSTTV